MCCSMFSCIVMYFIWVIFMVRLQPGLRSVGFVGLDRSWFVVNAKKKVATHRCVGRVFGK